MQLRISKISAHLVVVKAINFAMQLISFRAQFTVKCLVIRNLVKKPFQADEITDVYVVFMLMLTDIQFQYILQVIATVESYAIIFKITIECSSSCNMVGRKFLSGFFTLLCFFFLCPKITSYSHEWDYVIKYKPKDANFSYTDAHTCRYNK